MALACAKQEVTQNARRLTFNLIQLRLVSWTRSCPESQCRQLAAFLNLPRATSGSDSSKSSS